MPHQSESLLEMPNIHEEPQTPHPPIDPVRRRILVLFAHPMIHRSNVNKALIAGIADLEDVTIHDLYAHYPDYDVDVVQEQNLLDTHDIIIFQFPLYWYAPPPILKVWQDMVLQYGYSYGQSGHALLNKKFMNVVTAGATQSAYSETGKNRFALTDFLKPIEQMAVFNGMRYLPPYIIYGAYRIRKRDIIYHVDEYRTLLIGLREGHIRFTDTEQHEGRWGALLNILRGKRDG